MKINNNIKKKRICFFFNNIRGLKVLNFFLKKKFSNYNVILSKKFLNKEVIKILTKKKIDFEVLKSLKSNKIINRFDNFDVGIICGFPLIFPDKIIKKFKYGLLNCHAGKLPFYRGGSPLNWQLINNEKRFGISVIKINNIIDGGPIISEKTFKVKNRMNINDLHLIANNNFPNLSFEAFKKILKSKKFKKQNEKLAKTYKQRSIKDSKINIKKMNFTEVDCFVRALQQPYPNAYIKFKNKIIKIKKIKKSSLNIKPGIIILKKKKIFVGCKDKGIEILKSKFM